MMMNLPRTAVLLCLVPSAAALYGFQLHGDPECDNGLTFENVQLTCGPAYQGYSYGYNNNRGYGNGYKYNGGYNNGGQYTNNYNPSSQSSGSSSSQASDYMGKYYNTNSNSNGNQNQNQGGGAEQQQGGAGNNYYQYNNYMNGQQQQQQQQGPEEEYYMNNINGQVAGWTPEGTSTCVAGDTAYITGTLSIPDTGLYGYDMKNRVCLYGQDWGWLTCKEFDVDGASFCSMFGLMSYGCPETGQFQVTTSFNLPAQGEGYDLAGGVSGWYSYIYTTLNTTDGFIYTCKTRIDTVNPSSSSTSSSYSAANQWNSWKAKTSNWYSQYSQKTGGQSSSSSYLLIGFSAVGVAGLLTASVLRRRRLRAQLDLAQEEGAAGDFEMMGEGVVRV